MAPRTILAPEGVLPDALGGEKVAHVASQPARRRYGFVRHRIAAARDVEFFVGEIEEGLILAVVDFRNVNRTSDASAAVELAVASLGQAEKVRGKRLGVEKLIASLEQSAAVHPVRAGLHHEIEHAAGGLAVLGAHAAGFHLELLQRFRRGTLFANVTRPVSGGGCAIDQNRLREVRRPDQIVAGHSRHQLRRKARGVAAAREAQRQIHHLIILEGLADRGGILLKHLRLGRHRDRLGGRPDLERGVDAPGLRNAEFDIGLYELLQAIRLEDHFVFAGRQVGRRVLAGAGRRRLVRRIGCQVPDRNLNARYDRSGRIREGPRNRAPFLGEACHCKQHHSRK